MDVILRAEIPAKPGISLGLFFFQLTEQSSAILSPEMVVVDVAVIGCKQGIVHFSGPAHNGGNLILVGVQNRDYALLPALFHQLDTHHLSLLVPHAVVRGDPGNKSTAVPTGFRDGDFDPGSSQTAACRFPFPSGCG